MKTSDFTPSKLINQPIGFFDSGIGGLTVLAKAMEMMPEEEFIYFADTSNAPYGEKSRDSIQKLTNSAIEKLLTYNVKAIVIACNTATSASIQALREKYPIPFIGMEPALKPAIECTPSTEKILVMATPLTLQEEKFRLLASRYCSYTNIEMMPCPGLAETIERGADSPENILFLLKDLFSAQGKKEYSTVVLGCTHYVFAKDAILQISGASNAVDGNEGTIRHLYNTLLRLNIKKVSSGTSAKKYQILSSAGATGIYHCEKMLKNLSIN